MTGYVGEQRVAMKFIADIDRRGLGGNQHREEDETLGTLDDMRLDPLRRDNTTYIGQAVSVDELADAGLTVYDKTPIDTPFDVDRSLAWRIYKSLKTIQLGQNDIARAGMILDYLLDQIHAEPDSYDGEQNSEIDPYDIIARHPENPLVHFDEVGPGVPVEELLGIVPLDLSYQGGDETCIEPGEDECIDDLLTYF